MSDADTTSPSGLPQALGAYVTWGFMPLYLLLVRQVPAFEFVGWRIVWTLPVCLMIVAFRGQFPAIREALADRRALLVLAASAVLIAVNWLVYVWAIQQNQVYAASLGYYINPLVNILLGTLLLKERLTRAQWIAVALAGVGIAVLAGGALSTLWISLTLAFSFATYGLLRKQVSVGALPGLTIESAILVLPALGVAAWFWASPQGSSFDDSLGLSLAIMLGGLFTAVPLLMFAIAARRMDYSVLGFVQFLAPSIVFILGLTVFGEELHPAQAFCFGCIWIAAAIFVWDLLARRRAARKPTAIG
ncbi:EamA family transporter RarD [Alteriqipengyuania lutimaris]|uniref:EamA family transporter RarD n=1 Tax=Alteriqipengyuania lutimaris TaxID=1538146 RepID=A0A395LVP5_9SPHN|nr:EamA family transporter RarD [Alteriqipengyuania lutimaris]MBB3033176.1 chloramphenicol-sensitive protein RarD [Alteriqipengyuania lutimaris]RDS78630.1 EamA family transporter RarD [Alteriqipengyuania lutimaris]